MEYAKSLPGSKGNHATQAGQALTEYMIGTVFLVIIVWYGLVGGSPDALGNGGLWETDAVNAKGTYLEQRQPSAKALPGLIQSLHKKQDDFQNYIYQP